jgi:threonine/homoserine/homoserine lactone efflux protein
VPFVNPKIAPFMLALLSKFISPVADWGQRWIMLATLGLLDALWFCSVVTLVSREQVLARLQGSHEETSLALDYRGLQCL